MWVLENGSLLQEQIPLTTEPSFQLFPLSLLSFLCFCYCFCCCHPSHTPKHSISLCSSGCPGTHKCLLVSATQVGLKACIATSSFNSFPYPHNLFYVLISEESIFFKIGSFYIPRFTGDPASASQILRLKLCATILINSS